MQIIGGNTLSETLKVRYDENTKVMYIDWNETPPYTIDDVVDVRLVDLYENGFYEIEVVTNDDIYTYTGYAE